MIKEVKDFYSNPGSPVRVEYRPKVLDNGVTVLVEDGISNIQEFIDSFRESSDVAMLVKKYQATGDPSLLNRSKGFFMDATKAPNTLAQALQLQIDSERLFMSLPVETRAKFNHDKNQFFAQSGTQTWYESMREFIPEDIAEKIFPAEKVGENKE